MRSRLLIPNPQVTLQGSHSAHSVTTQLLGAVGRIPKNTQTFSVFSIFEEILMIEMSLENMVTVFVRGPGLVDTVVLHCTH